MNKLLLFAESIESISIDILTAAFAADPVARWVYPADAQYRSAFPEFVRRFAGRAFECGTADTHADGQAAVLWLPPGESSDEAAVVAHVEAMVAEAVQPLLFDLMEQMGSFHPAGPHWYLPLIGVEPAAQGRGYGSELLARGLVRCDRDSLPAYLESSNPRNVPLYERHGFRVIGMIHAGNSPVVIPMLRQPKH